MSVFRIEKTRNYTIMSNHHAPMRWMQQMNSLKAQAEEILLAELIYN